MNTITANKNLKTTKIIYWIFTSIFVLLDGLLPALTFNSDLAKQGISHMGFPDYFRIELSVGKIIGGILLILPMIPSRFKEWAYVGYGISLISAFIGNIAVDGFTSEAIGPVVGFAILLTSYIYYHKLLNAGVFK